MTRQLVEYKGKLMHKHQSGRRRIKKAKKQDKNKNETYIAIIIGTHRVISLCGQKHHKHKSKNTETLSVQKRKREETVRS